MPRLILKSPYLKPSQNAHLKNYVEYMATRQGVEAPESENALRPVTQKLEKTLRELLQKYPDCKDLFEWEDYKYAPNQGNGRALLLAIADTHPELLESREGYISYMAHRPGAEKLAGHGLFSSKDTALDLAAVKAEIEGYPGNVWTHIISLCREDAARLGYDNASAWRELLRRHQVQIAAAMKIRPENFRWYAAFHNSDHHPHIHMVAFSSDPKEAYLSRQGIQQIKSVLARDIFQNDLISIYQEQTKVRNELRQAGKEILQSELQAPSPVLEQLFTQLVKKLQTTKGKKVYGYLPASTKKLVDAIVDELARHDTISDLYSQWYEQKAEIAKTYQDRPEQPIPLSQNKEFKPIRNAVVAETVRFLEFEGDAFPPREREPEPVENAESDQRILETNRSQIAEWSALPTVHPSVTNSALVLLRQASRIFENRIPPAENKTAQRTDRKLRSKIAEKKLAQGLKLE